MNPNTLEVSPPARKWVFFHVHDSMSEAKALAPETKSEKTANRGGRHHYQHPKYMQLQH